MLERITENIATMGGASSTPEGRFARFKVRKLGGFIVGLLLVAGAIWALRGNTDGFRGAWERTIQRWWSLPVLLGLPLLNWALVSATFYVLTKRDAQRRPRVSLGEMSALIGASALANYLPLKPGLLGRVAYHKSVNAIPVVESAGVIFANVMSGCSACVLVLGVGVTGVAAQRGMGAWGLLATMSLPALACALVAWRSDNRDSRRARWSLAILLRYLDTLVWAVRYVVVFELVGLHISPAQAALFAGVSNVASLVPIAGNGLGLREWAIGLVAPLLPGWLIAGGTRAATSDGLTADLINRLSELVVTIPLGIACGVWVARRMRRAMTDGREGVRVVDPRSEAETGVRTG